MKTCLELISQMLHSVSVNTLIPLQHRYDQTDECNDMSSDAANTQDAVVGLPGRHQGGRLAASCPQHGGRVLVLPHDPDHSRPPFALLCSCSH